MCRLVHPLLHPFQHRFAEQRNLPIDVAGKGNELGRRERRWSAGIAGTGRSTISSNKRRCSSISTKEVDGSPRAEWDSIASHLSCEC
jgi:hypothetical protein